MFQLNGSLMMTLDPRIEEQLLSFVCVKYSKHT